MSECNSIECSSVENTDLTYYKKKDVVLNKAKDYYKNNKDRVRKKPEINTETYLKKKKNKKREYGKNRYHKMSEEKKTRLKEYQKNYYEAKKSQYIIIK